MVATWVHSFYTQLLSQTFVIYKPNMTHVVPQHTKNRIQLYMNLVFLRNIFNVHSKSSQVKSNNNPIKLFICCLFYEFGLCCSSNSIISILFYFSSVKTIVYSFFLNIPDMVHILLCGVNLQCFSFEFMDEKKIVDHFVAFKQWINGCNLIIARNHKYSSFACVCFSIEMSEQKKSLQITSNSMN